MRKHILGAAVLLVVSLLVGCKDTPAVQPSPPPPADPVAGGGLAAPPKASTDAAQPSGDGAAGSAAGADAAPSGEAAKTPQASEAAKPPAASSTSTKSKSKSELPKAELPRLEEPAAKQQATAPMLEPPKATGSAAAEPDAGGSKPAIAPIPTDLVTPPMAGSSASSMASDSAGSAAKAQALYKNNCMVCHGDKLQGDIGPNLTKVGTRLTKDKLMAAINNGSKAMPPFQTTLKADQVEALASWLAAQK